MTFEIISAVNIKSNLKDYTATYNTFNWQETEKNFTWYNTNKVNIAYEAIDRHANSNRRNKIALHYKDFYRTESYTFFDLMELSNRAGNILKTKANVKKGDNVFIFMPRTPELYILLLGTVKLGAIIGPLFEIFMEDALRVRLENSQAKVLITTPELLKRVPLTDLPSIESIVLVGENIEEKNKFIDYYKEMKTVSRPFDLEWVDREDGYIIHYTSGSTGKPKGVCLTHNSMIQLYQTAKWVLDLKDDDIYWCTADPGWVTGTTYGILAPWLLGVTSVVTGDRFNPDVWYKLIEEYNVNVWYSAPTAFRMLMGANEEVTNKYDLSSLRNILSVGEPLNPEVIRWALKVFRLPIHDTWFMTETGAQIICNYPCMDIRLGSMGKPIPGIEAAIVDNNGKELPPLTKGNLAIKKYWPSIMRMIWQNKEKYDSYFIEDWYISGDSAYMDEDGYFWFQGRTDDVINSAGEMIGPFEIECKLIEHPAVEEAGVIGKPDPIRGQIIKAFVTLRHGYKPSLELKEELSRFVKTGLAANSAPREIEFIDNLPKTKSGKIMRSVLKDI